ncbi:MAG: Low conductance mechanosensitive channel YnaI [Elusimicrobia bacterium]|nr:Low conductance mechanosensitive channel YnaI [Elusimicrobiota bacterium]
MITDLLNKTTWGNTFVDYGESLLIFILGVVATGVLRFFILRRVKKWTEQTKTQYDDFLFSSIQKFAFPLIYFGIFSLALKNLSLSAGMARALSILSVLVVSVIGILFLTHLLRFSLLNVYAKKFPDQPDLGNRLRALMPAFTVLIWVLGVIFLLDNLGFQISAIITGLGIGGVAVALAASVVLNDLFAYFAIMFDQPFVIGDFIIVGEFMGTVEKIGVKTTRIRSLGGELLVFSNKDITDSRVRNFQRMDRRRIVFKLGVTYTTSVQMLEEIPSLIKRIIQEAGGTTFDRAHFSSFGDFNLLLEIVYYVESADYNRYMDIQQEINLAIKKEFEKRNIQFAFPTQTLHVEGLASLSSKSSSN